METWDAICARGNVRQYKPQPVITRLPCGLVRGL
jgi:hypothetical protein